MWKKTAKNESFGCLCHQRNHRLERKLIGLSNLYSLTKQIENYTSYNDLNNINNINRWSNQYQDSYLISTSYRDKWQHSNFYTYSIVLIYIYIDTQILKKIKDNNKNNNYLFFI